MQLQKTEEFVAKVFSWLFHPVWMPTISLAVVFYLPTYVRYTVSEEAKWFILFTVLLNTCLIPIGLSWMMKLLGKINNLQMPTREERIYPFITTAFFYGFCYYLLLRYNLPQPLLSLMFGATLALILSLLIHFKWKISAHMIGIGGLVAAVFGFAQQYGLSGVNFVVPPIIIAGLIGFSRLRLNAHSPLQVYFGFIAGFAMVYASILLEWG